jgi:hypothetical protein
MAIYQNLDLWNRVRKFCLAVWEFAAEIQYWCKCTFRNEIQPQPTTDNTWHLSLYECQFASREFFFALIIKYNRAIQTVIDFAVATEQDDQDALRKPLVFGTGQDCGR